MFFFGGDGDKNISVAFVVRIFMARLYLREIGRGGKVGSESGLFKAKGY